MALSVMAVGGIIVRQYYLPASGKNRKVILFFVIILCNIMEVKNLIFEWK
jgi:hypothetical protein